MSSELPRPVRVFSPADLAAADPTPGVNRALGFELPLLWAGQVETEPGAVSGWHHHERNESSPQSADARAGADQSSPRRLR